MKLSDKTLKIIIAMAVVVLGVSFILGGYIWFDKKQRRVLAGTARPTFPYSDYSIDELNKLFPQYLNEDVATTQTPEETYGKFITALKAENFEEAARCCFRGGDQEKMINAFKNIKQKGQLSAMIKDLDTKIEKDWLGDNKGSYSYTVIKDGEKYGEYISFIKNSQGVWLIESL